MLPGQARGDGHRVGGRSDVFSLGVVFYELLTGRRPPQGNTREELLDQTVAAEARPPRQRDDAPRELGRVCLKALAKRASERYTAAQDMADDLRIPGRPTSPGAGNRPAPPAPPTSSRPSSAWRFSAGSASRPRGRGGSTRTG
jgi:serine/threonine protein kinase